MTYEPSPSLIPRVVSIVDIREDVMNIMQLAIQVLEPYCAIGMMCILCHVEVLKLIENHSLKLGICRSSILKRVVQLNCHWLRFMVILVSSISSYFMVICSNFNVNTLISFNQLNVAYLSDFHLHTFDTCFENAITELEVGIEHLHQIQIHLARKLKESLQFLSFEMLLKVAKVFCP